MKIDTTTANGMMKLLYRILEEDISDDEAEIWGSLTFSAPIVNNMVVTTEEGKQYTIQVKPVSR